MIIDRHKGGEFNAESTCEDSTRGTKMWDSSVEQHRSVVDTAMLKDVAARIPQPIRAFSITPESSSFCAGFPQHENTQTSPIEK